MSLLRRTARQALAVSRSVSRRRRKYAESGLVILGLHKVRGGDDALPLTLAPDLLERTLTLIGERYGFASLAEVAADFEEHFSGRRRFAITFDDGYRDNFENAWPVLRRLGVPATIFLSVDHVNGKRVFWYEALAGLLLQSGPLDAKALQPLLGDAVTRASLPRKQLLLMANDALKSVSDSDRMQFISALSAANATEAGVDGSPMLTWGQVTEMQRGGISFGSHTLSHPILSREPDEVVVHELAGSRAYLESRLGSPVEHLAYPNGRLMDIGDRIVDAARASGYRLAVTTVPGVNGPGADPLLLKRINLHNEAVRGLRRFSPSVFWAAIDRHTKGAG